MEPLKSPTDQPNSQHAQRVADLPERLRPREAVEHYGVGSVSDDVLIAILLRSGVKGLNVSDLARSLLTRYETLSQLASATVDELAGLPGMGPVKAQVLACSLELARRLSQESLPERYCIRSPQDVYDLLRESARPLREEVFWVLLLDTRHRVVRAPLEVTRGILDAGLVHPREVFREAIACGCSGIVLAHNHPSGDPAPSKEDIGVTRQLVEAGKVIDIRVLDHVVLGRVSTQHPRGFSSIRELGLVSFSE